MKSTVELEHGIRESETPDMLTDEVFEVPEVTEYLHDLLRERGFGVQEVVSKCNMDRSYGYQMLNGTRKPTRNFLLKVAFLLQMPEEEAQRLLKISGRKTLYARNRRDAAILYGLTHGLTAAETEAVLRELGEDGLT